jgi:exopolysaccharide production protein ExoZ
MGKSQSIQSLRGLAALFVALYHASGDCKLQFGDAGCMAIFDGRFGLAGVAIFFAISGLLMADLVQRTDPWQFLAHRIVRIYPTYLLIVLMSVSILGLLNIWKFGPHIFSLLLVPAGERTYYLGGPEWTLVFECTYYVALFLIAAAGLPRHLNWIVSAWLAAIFAAPLIVGWNDNLYFNFYSLWMAPANVAFAGGLLVPWIARNVRIPLGAGVLACCILLIIPPGNPMVARWAAGAAATLLVLDAIRIKPSSPRAMLGLPRLGDWSYALYLTHVPIFAVVYHFWPPSFGVAAAWTFAMISALLLSAGFGIADVWLYQRLKSTVDALDADTRRYRVNVYVGVFIIASAIGVLAP